MGRKFDPQRDWEQKQAKREARQERQALTGTEVRMEEQRAITNRHMEELLYQLESRAADDMKRRQQEDAVRKQVVAQQKAVEQSWRDAQTYYETGMPASTKTMAPSFETVMDVETGEVEIWMKQGGHERVRYVRADAQKPTNKINMVWLAQAHERTMQSDMIIRLQLEGDGIVLIAVQGDDYDTRLVTWDKLAKATSNILLGEITALERQMNILSELKAQHGDAAAAA